MNRLNRLVVLLAGASTVGGLAGCLVRAEPEPVVYAEADTAPAEVEIASSPYTYYEGRTVYLYRDRWYYRAGGRWAYYREEPPVLYRHRRSVRQAPPVRRD